jgi:hypothetical protein
MSAESTLGAHLRRCRERSGLSAETVAAGSRIAGRLVHALETDRQGELPAPVYVRDLRRPSADVGRGLPPRSRLALATDFWS